MVQKISICCNCLWQ